MVMQMLQRMFSFSVSLIIVCTIPGWKVSAATLHLWQTSPNPAPPNTNWLIAAHSILNDLSWQTLQTIVGDGTIRTFQYPIDGAPQRFFLAVEAP